jgi:hypothetical protein
MDWGMEIIEIKYYLYFMEGYDIMPRAHKPPKEDVLDEFSVRKIRKEYGEIHH